MVTAGPAIDTGDATNPVKSATNAVVAAIRPRPDDRQPGPAHVSEVATPRRSKWTFEKP
jgi:hypothetical protein